MGITCSLGSAERRDLKCVILGPKMTYTNGLGSAERSPMQICKLAPHGAGTHSIEGKKWHEKAGHFATDFRKRFALMVTKWDSYPTVQFRNRNQNFFQGTRGRLVGRSIEHSKRCWLRFGSRADCQNFLAFFRGTLKNFQGSLN